MKLVLDTNSIDDYRTFIKAKALPRFRCIGHEIEFPDEYAALLGLSTAETAKNKRYVPIKGLFDYQAAVAKLSIRKKKFGIFMACGRGKDLTMKETARYVAGVLPKDKKILIMEPLNCVEQSLEETRRWYGDKLPFERVKSGNLNDWLMGSGGRLGICNYDGLNEDTPQGKLGALFANEGSIFKSNGVWASTMIRIGTGLTWKFIYTGTPAPNDRIEYGNHAVFLDQFPTLNSFYARYFVNKGETNERWVMKPHAVGKFYREISHWCILLDNPAVYGFKDNCEPLPPINVHIHEIDLTGEQREAVYAVTGKLFMDEPGGITTRSKLSQIGKGNYKGQKIEAAKPLFIKNLVDSWRDKESTIIWCKFDAEQDDLERMFPGAASIRGKTKYESRVRMIREFQRGENRVIISKAECMGWGLNLQIATRQVFSACDDSWEKFHQCLARSSRIGATKPLNAHIPVSEIERPQMENVLRKARRINEDAIEQEADFKKNGVILWN